MKKLFLVYILCFIGGALSSQKIYDKKSIPGSNLVEINEKTGTIKHIQLKPSSKIPINNHKGWLKSILNVSGSESLNLTQKNTDDLGFVHYRYQEQFNGVHVEGMTYYVHTKNGFVVSSNGEYLSDIKLSSTIPSISPYRAISLAKKYIHAEKYLWKDEKFPLPKLIIIKVENNYKLVYKTDVYAVKPLARKYVFVDALNGEIVKEENRIYHADVNATAITKYSGTQTITTDSNGGSYRLQDSARNVKTYDLNNAYFTSSAVDFTDTDNYWNNINPQKDEVATDAHWGAEKFYDYFSIKLGRNSYDNSGGSLISYVHYGINYDNAFWDGTAVSYGDGNGSSTSPYTAVDIVAHEFSHGVTEHTANLVYSYESGALNESFSDIFSVAVDFYARPSSANYTIGEQVSISGVPSRNMANPNQYGDPDTYLGTNWATGPTDNGGVHTNSGVQNFWFYLLTNGGTGTNDIGSSYSVIGIGMDKAAKIAYRTLSVYLTSNSQYSDARAYSIQAAVDLYGACSAEAVATQEAWYAVGVGTSSSNSPVVAAFTSDIQYSCVLPATVNFTSQSQNATISHKWYFGDGDSSSVISPTHIYTAAGTYSVTLVVEGVGSCGSQKDTLIQSNLITITNGGGPGSINCSPPTTSAGSAAMGIYNFSLNTINNSTSGGTDGYQDYSCSNSTSLTEGIAYSLSVTTGTGYNEDVKVWIDFNNNGVFNAITEKVFESDNIRQNHSGSITIPAGTTLNTPLRLRVTSDYANNTVDVCTNSYYGQHEDYTVTILPNTNPPVADFMADNVVVNVSQAVNFTDLSQNIPTAWVWEFTGGIPASSSLQNPSVTYSAVGTYPVKLKTTNAFGTDSLIKTAYINVVNQFNMCGTTDSTNATSGQLFDSGGPTGNYSAYENCSFLINPGCALSVTLNFNSFYSPTSSDYLRVYDGTDATGTLLGTYSYITTPPTSVTANSGSMYITWYSNCCSNYSGFGASWTSVVPSTAPVANFSISDSTPPLNSVVDFTDLTTNMPNAWTWNFGDGNYAYTQSPPHVYATPGTYSVQLITDNCFALDTVSYNLTIQDSAFISIQPDTLFATVACGDSITKQLTVFNSGNGELVTSINGATTNSSSSAFFDGFEDGTYNNWNVISTANTYQIVSTNPASGNNCLSIQGPNNPGIVYSFTPDTVDYVSVSLRTNDPNGNNNFVRIGTNSSVYGLCDIYRNSSSTYRIQGSTLVIHNVPLGNWMKLEFKNINFNTKTFDLHADGSLIQSGMGFNNSSLTNLSQIALFQNDISTVGYYDDVQIGGNVSPQWISMAVTDTLVPANDSVLIDVDFNASGLLAGAYTSDLEIISNDSTNSPIIVPVVFTVTGQPIISLTPSVFTFDSTQVGALITDTLYIDNMGCDTLNISSFVSTDSSFTVNSGSMQLPPYSSDTVIVTFVPDTIKMYADTIFINNNDTVAYVLVNGVGVGAPTISYNPTSITDTLFGCNDSVTIPVMVYNTGQGSLYSSVNINGTTSSGGGNYFYDGFENGTLSNWTDQGGTYTKQITSSNPATGNYCLEMINGTSTHLNGVRGTFSNATPNEISFKVKSTVANNYGSFVNIGDNPTSVNGILYFFMNNSGNFYVNNTYVSNYVANQWYNIELRNINWTLKTYDFYINGALVLPSLAFRNTTVTQINRVDLYSWSSTGSSYFDDIQIGGVPIPNWITTNIDTLNVPINDSTQVDVKLYSKGLTSGTYTSSITINSNDPLSPTDTIPVTFVVQGSPIISSNISCINYGSVMQHVSKTDSLWVHNTGCDTLTISNIAANTSGYSTNVTSLVIPPFDSSMVYVTMNDSTIGANTDTLWFYSNAVNLSVCLTATITGAPVISTNPTSFNVNLAACGDSLTLPLTIYNTGGSTLNYSFSNILGNGFDSTITQYYTSTGQNLNFVFNGLTASDSVHLEVTINGDYDSGSEYASLYVDGNYMQQIIDGNKSNGTNIVTTYHYGGTNVSSWLADGLITVMLDNSSGVNTGIGGTGLNQVRLWVGGIGWITPSISSAAINSGDSSIVNITFNGGGMSGGVYNTNIVIGSNDPLNLFDSIPVTLTISNNPCAGFTYDIPNACSGQVNFTDATFNSPTSWSWDFGDGNTSTLKNPSNIYTLAKNYNVQLIACNSISCDTINYVVNVASTSGPINASCNPTGTNTYSAYDRKSVV